MNPDPDYSAAYVVLTTDNPDLAGHGLTFTIGRGNDICCAAIEAMAGNLSRTEPVTRYKAGSEKGSCDSREPAHS